MTDERRHRVTETPEKAERKGMDGEHKDVTRLIIACAIKVHRALGPGLLESVYEAAMAIELERSKVGFRQQVRVPAMYEGRLLGHYRIDFIVADAIVVEVKAVERFDPVFTSQVLTYMRVTSTHVGLLINFNVPRVVEGVQRFVL